MYIGPRLQTKTQSNNNKNNNQEIEKEKDNHLYEADEQLGSSSRLEIY